MYFNRLSQITGAEVEHKANSGLISPFRISCQNIESIVAFFDLILIIFACVAAGVLYHYVWLGEDTGVGFDFAFGAANGLLYVYVAATRGLYRLPVLLAFAQYSARLVVTWAIVGLFATSCLLLVPGQGVIYGSVITAGVLQIVLLFLIRWAWQRLSRSMMAAGSLAGSRVLTIGEPAELLRLSSSVLFRYFGLSEVGRVSVKSNHGPASDEVLAAIDRALHEAREKGVQEFVLALRWSSKELLETVRERLQASPLPVRLLPDYTIRSVLGRRAMSTGGPSLTLEVQRAPLTPVEMAMKRSLDLVCASIAILLLSPLLIIVATAVKLDSSGPIIFRQRRNGFNSKQFVIFKFRTMSVLEDGTKITQAKRGDHRVTRVGQLLRRSSIDELPQLFNVLKGDMSLVGPRPHALAHDNEYKGLIAKYAFRHHVKPGITGWAQVHGLRGETGLLEQMAERVKLDLWYVNHWSFGLDINILLRTCFEVMRNRAY
ncbi:undecaprenyl-phosphate glucose phosphotransferase [Methylocapsa palsarum]|uniref:Undecaprenyl-phosphate galactose phosphotransferase/putative colanic acid biosysnthesis UDP-glucose lipid carrier transferase n=1 Tax=Methylocapsa palsarum TaxID=1612308 RepID=A0A1I4ADJ5_9HYPH|nr:undecaprenyl-phosphate glucose phosphotransferase [Methylocapsa palsarum]SFK54137.1 undecaprenyl-phosphate galactose phosphotransferase/putative colanic acid biosysnthesis UDP-glucose lipid carrier transferase [Methylocapsa palsarum]